MDAPLREVRLVSFDARPAYRFLFDRGDVMIYADDGHGTGDDDFSPDMTLRIASAWTRQPPASAKVEENREEDQWTVSGEFNNLRPLLKYTWPDGEQVYVSTVTGQVVQYTTQGIADGRLFRRDSALALFHKIAKAGAEVEQDGDLGFRVGHYRRCCSAS